MSYTRSHIRYECYTQRWCPWQKKWGRKIFLHTYHGPAGLPRAKRFLRQNEGAVTDRYVVKQIVQTEEWSYLK